MKLLFACREDSADENVWSGLVAAMHRALCETGFEVETFDQIPFDFPLALRVLHQLYKRLSHRVHQVQIEPRILLLAARRIEARFAASGADAVFCPGTGVPVNTFIAPTIPVFTYADATKASWISTYFPPDHLSARSRRHVSLVDRASLENNRLTFFSSDWAAAEARRQTGVSAAKIRVVPFGANLKHPPTKEQVATHLAERDPRSCRLLFLGKEWERKGGPLALEVVKELRSRGVMAVLEIVGCAPALHPADQALARIHGFIDRSTASGSAQFAQLASGCHFLLFFSQAEAYGLALAEANAFGIPCLAHAVGGIPTIIREGINGHLFSRPDAAACAEKIAALLAAPDRYRALCRSSRAEFETRLNWTAAGQTLRSAIESSLLSLR